MQPIESPPHPTTSNVCNLSDQSPIHTYMQIYANLVYIWLLVPLVYIDLQSQNDM